MQKLIRMIQFFIKRCEGRIFIYAKKWEIKQAYREHHSAKHSVAFLFFTIIPVFFIGVLVLGVLWYFVPFLNSRSSVVGYKQEVLLADTIISVQEDLFEADFLEPFNAISGMEEMRHLIVADKHHRVLYLLSQGAHRWGVVRTFPISIGSKEGRKEYEGDRRTPEGLYFVVSKMLKKDLHEIYGPMAFVLNFPNKEDRAVGRTGSGIWIHGTSEGAMPINTRGCIELHNYHLEEFSTIVGDDLLMPVLIVNKRTCKLQDLIDLPHFWTERHEVGIEFGLIDTLPQEDFVSVLDTIHVDTSTQDISVVTEVLVVDPEVSESLLDSSAILESASVDVDTTALFRELKEFLRGWEHAWESRQMEQYDHFYDHGSFMTIGENWAKWKQKKQRTFIRYQSINIFVDNPKFIIIDAQNAQIRFRQQYESERFSSDSGKMLTVKKDAGEWKITNEIAVEYP